MAYDKINWENGVTPNNEENLGKMDNEIDRLANASLLTGKDANTLVGEFIAGSGNGMINTPNTAGYFINIPHTAENGMFRQTYNLQLFLERDGMSFYQRRQVNGVWKEWLVLKKSMSTPAVDIILKATQKIVATNTYENIAVRFGAIILDSTLCTIEDDTNIVIAKPGRYRLNGHVTFMCKRRSWNEVC